MLEWPSHQNSPWFLSCMSLHKSHWASGVLAGSQLNLSLLGSILILISSPLCIIGTQTSKAYPFHPKPKKFLAGKNINNPCLPGQCRSGNGFWLSGWNATQGPPCLWAMVLFECPWVSFYGSFPLASFGLLSSFRGIPPCTPPSSICILCSTFAWPLPGIGPSLALLHFLMDRLSWKS